MAFYKRAIFVLFGLNFDKFVLYCVNELCTIDLYRYICEKNKKGVST